MRKLIAVIVALAIVVLAAPTACSWLGLGPGTELLPPAGRTVAIGGGRSLDVHELGTGPPVVLVHGLPSNVGDWGALPERLAARGHHVVVYDRIGYGRSSRASVDDPDAYTYASSARDLADLLDALKVGPATLVGWSYGGGVVQQLAMEAPARAARLVLVGSVGPLLDGGEPPSDAVGRLAESPIGPAVFRWVAALPPIARLAVRAPVADAFSGAEHVPPGWVERTVEQLALPGTIDAWIAEERRADLSAVRPEALAMPTLVIQGSDDRLVPMAVAEDLARRLPDATLVRVEGGSHMLPATHPDLLAERIDDWMAR